MNDDFMGHIEFDLSAAQREVVAEAIDIASRSKAENSFASLNPLISIMQRWEEDAPQVDTSQGSPEERLVRICRWFIETHSRE